MHLFKKHLHTRSKLITFISFSTSVVLFFMFLTTRSVTKDTAEIITSYQQPSNLFLPDNGCVPNKETAIKIAELILLQIYSETIEDEKPFKANLVNDSIWVVVGSLPKKYTKGGVAYIEILKKDCKVLGIGHGK